jgi:hypothetical protein
MGVAGNPSRLQTGGKMSNNDFAITGGYKKKKRGGTASKIHLADTGGLY